MAVSKKSIEKTLEPFVCEEHGYKYLPKEMLDDASAAIASKYSNVYTMVEDCGNGIQRLGVGNAISKVKKPIYEIYTR